MAAANGVSHIWVGQNGLLSVAAASAIWVGQNGLLSVAAASAVVRGRVGHEESKASRAFILTGRHYPRGPHEDFGIKYNMENGGPAPEAITGKIYENMETIREVLIAEDLSDVDLSVISITSFASRGRQFYVEVFDSAYDYVELMKSIFDFKSIRKLLSSPKFTFCYDALHGVAGPYVKGIFLEELGADESSLMNCVCKEDFGGRHLDPGLTYASASELLARMGLGKRSSQDEPPLFGAATDGDANHNMIVGKGFSLVHLIPLLLLLQMLLKPYLTFLVVLRDLPGA